MIDRSKFLLLILLYLLSLPGCEPVNDSASFLKDVTSQVGLNFKHEPGVDGSYFMPESIGSGVALFDYDNDGDLDIYLINGNYHNRQRNQASPENQLYRQEANGIFLNATDESGLGDTGYGMGVAVGDIDNDGDLDVYVSNYGPDQLYMNNGDGTFQNITRKAGIDNTAWGCSVTFLDFDLDGYLDIYVTNYVNYDPSSVCMDRAGRPDYCGPDGFSGVPDVLYHNNRDGTFTDVSVASGIAQVASKGLGVVSADFNGDHLPDIYVANDGMPNHLWINQGNGTFKDLALELGAALNEMGQAEASMGIALGDADSDGDLDLFLTHLRTETNTFYRFSDQTVGFLDDTTPAGLAGPSLPYTGFGTGFFDYDQDGDLDLVVVNGRVTRGPLLVKTNNPDYWDDYAEPNFLFENKGNGRFENISHLVPEFSQVIENSRGLAFGDMDNDGDVDLLVTNEGGLARLFKNEYPRKGHWLNIRAINPKLHRDAYGARIVTYINDKKIVRIIQPGYSYLSSNDVRAHFGLGTAARVDSIQVIWPDGRLQTFNEVQADHFITIFKGKNELFITN